MMSWFQAAENSGEQSDAMVGSAQASAPMRRRPRSWGTLALAGVLLLLAAVGKSSGASTKCPTYGRTATVTNLARAKTSQALPAQRAKPHVWARHVNGKWMPVERKGSTTGTSQSDHNGTAVEQPLAAGRAARCCAVKCRSLVVPQKLLASTPYKSVVQIELYTKDDKYVVYCSGAVVAPRVILTAQHCFQDDSNVPLGSGIVKAVYTRPGVHSVERNILKWRWFGKCRNTGPPDYGVILLDKALPVPVLPLAKTLTSKTKRKLAIIGFPDVAGRPFGHMQEDSISIASIPQNRDKNINVQLNFDDGGSGGPLYTFSGAGVAAAVVGVGSSTYYYDDATCHATEDILEAPCVFGPVFNVADLMATL